MTNERVGFWEGLDEVCKGIQAVFLASFLGVGYLLLTVVEWLITPLLVILGVWILFQF